MFLNNDPVERFQLIEVPITSTTNLSFKLPDDDVLRNKKITGVCVYRRLSGGTAASPLNRTLVADADLFNGYLTFKCDNTDVLQNIPLQQIAVTPQDRDIFPVSLTGFSPTKSTINFSAAGTLATTQSLIIGFTYQD